MALVKFGNKNSISEADKKHDSVFEKEYRPGEKCEYEGIYKCSGCGKEATIAGGKTIPPQNHHQHTQSQGNVRWKLFVYAQ